MAEVSITLAEVSMIFGRTVMADVLFGRYVNWPMCHLADPSIGRRVIWPISLTFWQKTTEIIKKMVFKKNLENLLDNKPHYYLKIN